MFHSDRRLFLGGVGSLATLVALGGCDKILDQIKNRPVRKDVSTLANNDPILEAYRDAIAQMQALTPADKRNWASQANIHLNSCPHGNWFFLPWHRAYLMALDDIVRTLSGYKKFTMPYWNWTCNRAVPAPFWQAGSVLNHSPRAITSSSQADINVVGPNAMNSIMGQTNFETFASGAATALRGGGGFTGMLEGGPHNYIHGTFIRGTMATYLSPLDPIFWLHHCNLDRDWYVWNAAGNANTNDPSWVNFDLNNMFFGGTQQALDYKVGALILAPLLSYRYEEAGNCGVTIRQLDEAKVKAILDRGSAVRFTPQKSFGQVASGVQLHGLRRPTNRFALPAAATEAAMSQRDASRLVVRLDSVTPEGRGDYYVRVFVDLPAGAPQDPASDHYAGAFAFFVDPEHHHTDPLNFVVDVSDTIDRLNAKQAIKPDQPLAVTLQVVPAAATETADGIETAMAPPSLGIGSISAVLIAREKPQE